MKKIAFIFPGQGSQYVGMGKDFYETFPCAKEMIDLAEKVSGIPMKELLFEENENINITKYTQIAMLADELAIWSVLREKGLESVVCTVSHLLLLRLLLPHLPPAAHL